MHDSRTTQNDTADLRALEPPEPGLLAIVARAVPSSLLIPLVGGELVVGRSLLAKLGADDVRMSREHVHVSSGPTGWRFRDLESRNGSFVDGVRFTGAHVACAPRVLRAGETLFLPVADVRQLAGRAVEIVDGVVFGSAFRRAFEQISRAAEAGASLHLHGETGVGKELAARYFHARGKHARGPFVAVNCAAVPPQIAERLFFGVRRGAYTGADADADGFLQAADGGTLFLDEIADLDLAVQAKLLRTLESREVVPLGASKARSVDLTLVSATAVDLEECVARKTFREDLYFRVARPAVRVPPLRDRLDEIPWLASEAAKGSAASLHFSFVEAALCRAWPGNVREFLVEARTAVRAANDEGAATVRAGHLGPGAGALLTSGPNARPTEADLEESARRAEIVEALRRERGNIAATARRLGIHRTQLRRLLVRLEIDAHAIGR
jgi:transcriptional regulator with PAS, ATPase and Fis domain